MNQTVRGISASGLGGDENTQQVTRAGFGVSNSSGGLGGSGLGRIGSDGGQQSVSGLQVNKPIGDVTMPVLPGQSQSFTTPWHTFVSNGWALEATQANGQPLPAWLKFDPQTGVMGTPPTGVSGDIAIRIKATNSGGHEIVKTFNVKIGSQPISP